MQSALPLGKLLVIPEALDMASVMPSLGLALYLSRDQIGSLSSLMSYFATCLLELCLRVVVVLPTTHTRVPVVLSGREALSFWYGTGLSTVLPLPEAKVRL